MLFALQLVPMALLRHWWFTFKTKNVENTRKHIDRDSELSPNYDHHNKLYKVFLGTKTRNRKKNNLNEFFVKVLYWRNSFLTFITIIINLHNDCVITLSLYHPIILTIFNCELSLTFGRNGWRFQIFFLMNISWILRKSSHQIFNNSVDDINSHQFLLKIFP